MKNSSKFKSIKSVVQLLGISLSLLTIVSCSNEETLDLEENTELNSINESFATPVVGKTYFITNRATGRVMDINNKSNSNGANLQQWGTTAGLNDTHRHWEVRDVGNGYVRLKGVDSGKSLEVSGGSNSNGSNVQQWAYQGTTHQQWELLSTGSGYYRIKGRDSGKSMCVKDADTNDGANIEIRSWDGSHKFQWFFSEVGNSTPPPTVTPPTTTPPTSNPTGDLDPSKAPSENFDLSQWKITLSSGNDLSVEELNNEFSLSNQFFTDTSNGGMVFKNFPRGAGTTTNSTYSRVELREMLRGEDEDLADTRGLNKNNWVFSSSTNDNQDDAGGVDGILEATLEVNRVTNTGSSNTQRGRIIIGQIHASQDEPIRLYYHKLPNHDKGAIYFAHEPSTGNERFINILGDYADECTNCSSAGDYDGSGNPSNGIGLNEEFSYKIQVTGNMLSVTIYDSNGSQIGYEDYNMSSSGFANDWMYFKAGLYSANKTVTSSSDFEQVTFYSLSASHN